MTEDKNRKVVIIKGSDSGKLRAGDDIPLNDADAPQLPKDSPSPITIESMASHMRELASNPPVGRKNVYGPSSGHTTFRAGSVSPTMSAEANAFAPDESREIVHAMVREIFDKDTVRQLNDNETGLHEVLRTIVTKESTIPAARNPEHKTADDAGIIQKRVSKALETNRFNPTPGKSAFIPTSTSASALDSRSIGQSQKLLGVHLRDEPRDEDGDTTTNITFEEMKKIGLALMLRATGDVVGIEMDPTNAAAGLGALLPGSAQITGAKVINRRSMWASNLAIAQGKPNGLGDDSAQSATDITLDNGRYSYGNLNSYLEPFGDLAPGGMIALGAALVLALKLLSEAFELILSIPSPPTPDGIPRTETAEGEGTIYQLGKSTNQPSPGRLDPVRIFGYVQTKHSFVDAFDRGVDVFFGFSGASDIASGFVRVADSPGYYVIMVREIIRSGGQIVEAIKNAFASGDVFSAAMSIVNIADLIRRSKITAYFNIVARLGDVVLSLEDDGVIAENANGFEIGKIRELSIDRIVINPASRIMKSRESIVDMKLAWRTGATPSVYMLPASVLYASDYIQGNINAYDVPSSDIPTNIDDETFIDRSGLNGRLQQNIARAIEDELDSEYVPFYFHDLRTNEIVSFHAFLAGITDSFNASYETTKFYGRVDPVRVYSDTERTIQLSFNIVSTNYDDFDVMWWKINKLVTLIYPQWSAGKKIVIEAGKNEFIQPFSQIPTSSPVIRLRLGDIFRSNYSKFALARLFGLGTEDFTADGSKIDRIRDPEGILYDVIKERKRVLTKPKTADDVQKFGYAVDDEAYLQPTSKITAALNTIDFGPQKESIKTISHEMKVTITKVEVLPFDDGTINLAYHVNINESSDINDFSPGPYIVNFEQLRPDEKAIKAKVLKNRGQDELAEGDITSINKFFASAGEGVSGNAIVRAFDSVAGRGLAGVITSLDFDWHTPTWETRKIGSRAPQWCKVNMTFMPIHDIAPGIDSQGFNRAPIYNVGRHVNAIGGDPHETEGNKGTFSKHTVATGKNRRKK